jgi:hypothetical protein
VRRLKIDLQCLLADLRVQFLDIRLVRLRDAFTAKGRSSSLQHLRLPLRHLRRMHIECSAISMTVRWPLIASKATLALNAGE